MEEACVMRVSKQHMHTQYMFRSLNLLVRKNERIIEANDQNLIKTLKQKERHPGNTK